MGKPFFQFLTDVAWMDRDVLIIDTPPGTSDEHITVMENLRTVMNKVDGAILVTTPQVFLSFLLYIHYYAFPRSISLVFCPFTFLIHSS